MADLNKVVSFSGGKDSTALILLLKEREIKHKTVFCDTGWEHPLTMEYIDYINDTLLGGKLITLKSVGMRELTHKKKRVASARARFCTSELKIKPMLEWLGKEEIDLVYQGIRADESRARQSMPSREWSNDYDAYIERPLLNWSSEDVFNIHKKHGIEPNPLYKTGAHRVGCFPCVMSNHKEIKGLQEFYPKIWDRIEELEKISGRSFFSPGYIPAKFHSGFDEKSGKSYPFAKDVKKYLRSLESTGQKSFMPAPKCLSIYNLCE